MVVNLSAQNGLKEKIESYKKVKLTTDISLLSEDEKHLLQLFIRAAEEADQVFWKQAIDSKQKFLSMIKDSFQREFALINYGPWDRLDNNKPFVKGYGIKPLGAGFYPADMTKSQFDSIPGKDKFSPYTIIQKSKYGKFTVVPYNLAYFQNNRNISNALLQASQIAGSKLQDTMLQKYLQLRSRAFLTNDFIKSDIAWLNMKDNRLDIIIGPIENYEDQLNGLKTSYEAYVLVKDMEWSKRLEKYVSYLPELQKNLPVAQIYKSETPGSSSQLNAYDVVYYAGDCNAGSKTIAVNLPNDETIQTEHGTRRSQLKNVMQAKFDNIMLPIAKALIDPAQQKHVTFNAFFVNTMFHEVAHGLGIKNTIDGKGTVREALGADYSALEEGKADILGLYMVTRLFDEKVLTEGEIADYYVTFVAGIFRSVRFGASSAHGKANMVRFNYFNELGAFTRDTKTGYYTVNIEKMKAAIESLSALILELQGNGDPTKVQELTKEKGIIGALLKADLQKLETLKIPVDIIFEQGVEVLGLAPDKGLQQQRAPLPKGVIKH
ncbi:MAG: Zn-dependent hydrolase [Bacteroidia bacterium]|nr:Zn-dependent hydrolase [Bacteroidia bacterium]